MPAKARARSKTRKSRRNGGLDALQRRLAEATRRGGYLVKVGLPSGSGAYPDGTPVLMVGAIHEFGSEDGRIPERSWLRSAMREYADDHAKLVANMAKSVSSGDDDPSKHLEILGTVAASNSRQSIVDLTSPANAASTIRAKGSSNPLVDTGRLVQAVTHEVLKGQR